MNIVQSNKKPHQQHQFPNHHHHYQKQSHQQPRRKENASPPKERHYAGAKFSDSPAPNELPRPIFSTSPPKDSSETTFLDSLKSSHSQPSLVSSSSSLHESFLHNNSSMPNLHSEQPQTLNQMTFDLRKLLSIPVESN